VEGLACADIFDIFFFFLQAVPKTPEGVVVWFQKFEWDFREVVENFQRGADKMSTNCV
jgi:hypothetical protein